MLRFYIWCCFKPNLCHTYLDLICSDEPLEFWLRSRFCCHAVNLHHAAALRIQVRLDLVWVDLLPIDPVMRIQKSISMNIFYFVTNFWPHGTPWCLSNVPEVDRLGRDGDHDLNLGKALHSSRLVGAVDLAHPCPVVLLRDGAHLGTGSEFRSGKDFTCYI